MTDKKGHIYKHPGEPFTFLENVPEKVNEKLYSGDQWKEANAQIAYERAIAIAIENRKQIVNLDVLYKNAPLLDNIEDGETYLWAGTWDRAQQFKETSSGFWFDVPADWNPRNCNETRIVVRLIAPEQNDTNVTLLSKEQFNSPENQNRDKAIVGFKPVGESLKESGETAESQKEREQQILAWRHIYMDFKDGEGWIAFADRMMSKFTLHRKP